MEIILIKIDCIDGTVNFFRSDGKHATVSMPTMVRQPTSAIAGMIWAPSSALLHFETTKGDQIVAELPRPTNLAPHRERPVIYLDQNHWSTLANTIHTPNKGKSSEREAARHIIDLALARKVILPLSSGHMSETCKWTNDEARYRLALTILQLSSGWQMRDPLDVRRFELRQAFTLRFKPYCLLQPAVFTLEPDAIHGETREKQQHEPTKDLPEQAEFAYRALLSVCGSFDTMLDSESVEMDESPHWVDKFQRFTDWMATAPRDRQRRRQRTGLFFLADLGKELPQEAHRAGITPDQMSEWITSHSDTDIKAMPSLGLFREVLHEKLLNPGTRWESNDLTDLVYLTCAAGYADHVVGEQSLIAQMEKGLRRLGRTTRVHRHLAAIAETI